MHMDQDINPKCQKFLKAKKQNVEFGTGALAAF